MVYILIFNHHGLQSDMLSFTRLWRYDVQRNFLRDIVSRLTVWVLIGTNVGPKAKKRRYFHFFSCRIQFQSRCSNKLSWNHMKMKPQWNMLLLMLVGKEKSFKSSENFLHYSMLSMFDSERFNGE